MGAVGHVMVRCEARRSLEHVGDKICWCEDILHVLIKWEFHMSSEWQIWSVQWYVRVLGLEPTPFREECAAADIDTGADGSWVGGVDGLFPIVSDGCETSVFAACLERSEWCLTWNEINML